jgi:DNA-binding transcriptional regulator/RsmH inhibitor MraZ
MAIAADGSVVVHVEPPRGTYKCKVDAAGRLKLPAAIHKFFIRIDEPVFVTTMDCRSARLYCISEYKETEKFFQTHRGNAKAASNVALLANHFGANCMPDAQGRVALPDLLREKLALDGADVYLYFYKNRFELFTADAYNVRLAEAMQEPQANLAELEEAGMP